MGEQFLIKLLKSKSTEQNWVSPSRTPSSRILSLSLLTIKNLTSADHGYCVCNSHRILSSCPNMHDYFPASPQQLQQQSPRQRSQNQVNHTSSCGNSSPQQYSISSSSADLLPFANFLSYPIRRYHQSNRWMQLHTKGNQPAVATNVQHVPSALLSLSPILITFSALSLIFLTTTQKLDFLKSESNCCVTEMRHPPIGLLRISSRFVVCLKLVAYAS